MIDQSFRDFRGRYRALLGLILLNGSIIAETGFAADCPSHPSALVTSRTLVVDPQEHPRIGAMKLRRRHDRRCRDQLPCGIVEDKLPP